jgi:HlyD family secretion protein
MKRWIRWAIILGILGVLGVVIGGPGMAYLKERSKVTYRQVEVTKGKIVAVVNSTGTVKPVVSVTVGSFVAGPIKEFGKDQDGKVIDRLSRVKKGDLLARIDPTLYDAALAVADATLASQEAAKDRAWNNRELAMRKLKRGDDLRIQLRSLEGRLRRRGQAGRPGEGERRPGQGQRRLLQHHLPRGRRRDRQEDRARPDRRRLAVPDARIVHGRAQHGQGDLCDRGGRRGGYRAHRAGQPVHFTIDSSPDDLFEGKVLQIRMDSTTTQNVVTYPVVVSATNPDLKLKPGMTASVSFQVRSTADALRIPNAALRFFPPREQVRPEDRAIIENKIAAIETDENSALHRSAEEKADLRKQRNRRHVWVVDGDLLRAVEVVVGLSNNQSSELVSGELREGDKLVAGIQPRQ